MYPCGRFAVRGTQLHAIMDTMKVLAEMVKERKEAKKLPPWISLNDFLARVQREAKDELNEAYRMGIIKVHTTVNSKSIELIE